MLRPGLTLYVVRHGETDWNAIQRYQGQTDIPLNDKGRSQAARNGRALAELLGGRLTELGYCASPLSRASETMEILRRTAGLDPAGYATDDRLKEINFGHWEGELWTKLPETDPEGFAARRVDPWGWVPRGGESYQMLASRVGGFLATLERDTVVVTHGGVMRVIRGHLIDIAPAEIPRLEVPQDKILEVRHGAAVWR